MDSPLSYFLPRLCVVFSLMPSFVAAASDTSPWHSVNGFYIGMTKDAAKSAGMTDCKKRSPGEIDANSVFCAIPAARLKNIGGLDFTEGSIKFNEPKFDRIVEMRLRVSVPDRKLVIVALQKAYGAPQQTTDYNGSAIWEWNRGGSEVIRLNSIEQYQKSKVIAYFVFDPSVARSNRAASTRKTKDKAILDSFK